MPSTRASTTPKKENKCNLETKKLKHENSWVFLARDDAFDSEAASQIISLIHPGYSKPAKFLINNTTKKIYEIKTFEEPHRSWFIGESVKSDGSIYFTTPINPVFLVLNYLKEQCSSRAIPLEHILVSDNKSDLQQLTNFITDLSMVADLKGPADLCAYKYNEEKVLDWLESRVKKVSKVLKDKNMYVKSGATSATFITSNKKNDEVDEDLYTKYAFGIVSEYLNEDIAEALQKKLNLQPDVIPNANGKRKSEADKSTPNKKIKTEKEKEGADKMETKSDFFSSPPNGQKVTKPIVLSAKEKQRQKAASGTKNIMSFFSKK